MAHFAELDSNNQVIRVIVIDNDFITDDTGQEQESMGVAFCKRLFGDTTNWKQTSYNSNFRGTFAGPGFFYSESHDAFYPNKPYNSWVLNEDTLKWEAPVPFPDFNQETHGLVWDEELVEWKIEEHWKEDTDSGQPSS